MMTVWIVVQEISYPPGIGGEPTLKVTHTVYQFHGGDCKVGRGIEVVAIFETEREALEYVAYLDANGVVIYNPVIPLAEGELPESQRQMLRVFLLVEELHRRGYEQLRICPNMSPSGMHYRCNITYADNIKPENGAVAIDFDDAALHTSANGPNLFNWPDAADASIPELARMFIRRYPAIAKKGRQPDPAYVRWFQTAITFARKGAFPLNHVDAHRGKHKWMPTTGSEEVHLPLPPMSPRSI